LCSMLARIASRGAARSLHVAWMRSLAVSKRLCDTTLWRGRPPARQLAVDSTAHIAAVCQWCSLTSARASDAAARVPPPGSRLGWVGGGTSTEELGVRGMLHCPVRWRGRARGPTTRVKSADASARAAALCIAASWQRPLLVASASAFACVPTLWQRRSSMSTTPANAAARLAASSWCCGVRRSIRT
jgi:hypothetical protein